MNLMALVDEESKFPKVYYTSAAASIYKHVNVEIFGTLQILISSNSDDVCSNTLYSLFKT